MADFTPSVIFSLTQSPISQLHTVQNKTKKSYIAKSPPMGFRNVVTLQKISVDSQQTTANSCHAALTSNL